MVSSVLLGGDSFLRLRKLTKHTSLSKLQDKDAEMLPLLIKTVAHSQVKETPFGGTDCTSCSELYLAQSFQDHGGADFSVIQLPLSHKCLETTPISSLAHCFKHDLGGIPSCVWLMTSLMRSMFVQVTPSKGTQQNWYSNRDYQDLWRVAGRAVT